MSGARTAGPSGWSRSRVCFAPALAWGVARLRRSLRKAQELATRYLTPRGLAGDRAGAFGLPEQLQFNAWLPPDKPSGSPLPSLDDHAVEEQPCRAGLKDRG